MFETSLQWYFNKYNGVVWIRHSKDKRFNRSKKNAPLCEATDLDEGCIYRKIEKIKVIEVFHENGVIYYRGEALNGKADGWGNMYNDKGNLVYSGAFVDNKIHYYGTQYYKSGYQYYKGFFLNERFHGQGTIYYDPANTSCLDDVEPLYYQGEFLNGKKHGQGKLYNKEGKQKYDGHFFNDIKHGWGDYYYSTGELKYQGEFENDQFHGLGSHFDKEGNIGHQGEYRKGKLNGLALSFSKEGHLNFVGTYKNGDASGCGLIFSLMKKEDIDNNNLDFDSVNIFLTKINQVPTLNDFYKSHKLRNHAFFRNGEWNYLYYVGNFDSGCRKGTGTVYFPNGNVYFKGTIKENLKNGKGLQYNSKGNLIFDGYYKDNVPHGSDCKWYDEESFMIYHGDYVNGMKTGFGCSYYDDGNLYSKGKMKEDLPDGRTVILHKNSKIESLGYYGDVENKNVKKQNIIKNSDGTISEYIKDDKYKHQFWDTLYLRVNVVDEIEGEDDIENEELIDAEID